MQYGVDRHCESKGVVDATREKGARQKGPWAKKEATDIRTSEDVGRYNDMHECIYMSLPV
jgi:hypothetical protein